MRRLRVGYWALGIFVLVSVTFNFHLWADLLGGEIVGSVSDGAITEFILETGYQQVKSGQSPFERSYLALYPFGVNFSLNDPGIGVLPYYGLFRQFVGIHKAMILVLFTNLGLTGWLMWKWLRRIKISEHVALVGSLVFTFTPFISHRLLGHYTYVTMFVFPLFAIMLGQVLDSGKRNRKIWAVGLGAVLAWTLYLNFYYFIMIGLTTLVIAIWRRKWADMTHYLVAGVTALILLVPWLVGSYKYLSFENRSQTEGFGGAIHYSAELKSFLLPSAYNPFYQKLFSMVGWQLEQDFLKNWERMVYPGILVLGLLGYWALKRKTLPQKTRRNVDRWVLGGMAFAILTMGPFFKWRGSIELLNLEGVSVVLPLPFLLLHYLPGLDSLRVPGRFAPAMVFMFVTGGAYLFDHLLKKSKSTKKLILLALSLFVLDQAYQIPESKTPQLPTTIYSEIAKDSEDSTVLEIPFTVRDGFRYAGFVHAIGPMQGALIHQKNVVGGYLARVSDEVMEYYQSLKLTGYLLSVTDKGNYNPNYELPAPPNLYPYPYSSAESNQELDFLGVKYILVKQNEPYTEIVTHVLADAGVKEVMSADGYILYTRALNSNPGAYSVVGSVRENGDTSTMVGRDAKILLTGPGEKVKVVLTLGSEKERVVEWYLNEKRGGEIKVKGKREYELGEIILKSGINIIYLSINNLEEGEVLDGMSGLKIYTAQLDEL